MKKLVFLILFVCSQLVWAQNNQDSLLTIWNDTNKPDTTRLIALEKLSKDVLMFSNPDSSYYFAQIQLNFAKQKRITNHISTALYTIGVAKYFTSEFDSALSYYNQSLVIDQKLNNQQGIANNLNNIALVHKEKGNFDLAIKYNIQSLQIKNDINDVKGQANSYNNIGQIYQGKGNLGLAIINYTKSLKLKETLNDRLGIAKTLNNIGTIYFFEQDVDKAMVYFSKSLKIYEDLGEKFGIAGILQNLGYLYDDIGETDKALEYLNNSITIRREIGDNVGLGNSYNNIGVIHKNKKNYKTALDFYNKSLYIKMKLGDKQGLASTYNNIGDVYQLLNQHQKAIDYSIKALKQAQEIDALVEIRDAANALYVNYKSIGNFNKSLFMYELFISSRDSILSEENQKEVIRQEYKYNYEKKAAADSVANAKANEIRDAQIAQQKAEIKAKRNQQVALYGGLALVLVFAGFMYNRFKITQKQKAVIEQQKEVVEKAHLLLEEKNSEIIASIRYAKRIQDSLLTSQKYIERNINRLKSTK